MAEGLKVRGYRVFASARKPEDVEALAAAGFEALALDLADPDSIDAAVTQISKLSDGSLYALFNNGAYGQPGAVEDLSREVLREQFESNFFGTHQLTRALLPMMLAQGRGRIIQNSSVLGFVALAYRGAYTATKYALEGLSDTLRLELAGTGVYVSLIEPGPIDSRFRENAFAAYKRNIVPENSRHRDRYAAMERRLGASKAPTPFTLSPEAVLKRVIHALESRRPRPRYYVTFPTYLFAVLKRLLPHRLMDRVLRGAEGQR